ncbi:four helix bundle protein [Jejudonia soesokkakensis]|uniref:Four helix bundle protein n=1 Tax=Jejudonia soesokkakensis TaxID=1323432 RepID=A0ABW2MRF2_9FLAO
MHRYKDLKVWQLSREFCSKIYMITGSFPTSEKFGLISQLRRATISIPSNIAEGASRNSNKDFSRFLEIAIGSAYEIETQLLICEDLKFISKEESKALAVDIITIIKMLSKLKSTLKA